MPKSKDSDGPDSTINRHVGLRIRQRRIVLGAPQKHLAEVIGVNYRHLYKYELGTNRISVGILHRIAQALDVEIAYFFEGLDYAVGPAGPSRIWPALVHDFVSISNPTRQRAILRLARVLAGADRGDDVDLTQVGG
jgi:transcriptional regulator with XRE-family HTH domain